MNEIIKCEFDLIVEDRGGQRKIVGAMMRFPDAEIARSVMHGKIPGFEYCTDLVIRPFAGGQSEWCIGFVKENLWKQYTRNGVFPDPDGR